MACNCNKCNPNKCGCNDSALTNPCTYTDCSVGGERCEDIQLAECVGYGGTSFQVGSANELIKIETGERLDSIIQKFALMLSQGIGPCTSDDVLHAPYNFYATTITNSAITLVWDGESSLTTGINVYYDDGNGAVLANPTPIALGVKTFTITGLAPATSYTVYLVATDGGSSCNSIELLVDTIL